MERYQKGLIYKLCCKDLSIKDIYVGSTCNFARRKCQHKGEVCRGSGIYVYRFIRENGGWNNWDMILIEDYPCESKKQLLGRERYWFEKLEPSLNTLYPRRCAKEYRENHEDRISERDKKYRENNREKLCEQQKKYYENNKDKIKTVNMEYYEKNKDKIKNYRENNRDTISERERKYREKNKDKKKHIIRNIGHRIRVN